MGDFSVWAGIIVSLIGLGGPVITWLIHRSNNKKQETTERRVTELESVKADAEAIERAKKIYEDLIESMRIQHKDLRENVERLNREINEERNVSDALRNRVRELEDAVDKLEDELRDARYQISTLQSVTISKKENN